MTRNSGCRIAAMFALVALGTAGADEFFPVVHSETITVRVLDGKSGRPQPRLHIVLLGGYNRLDLQKELWREEALTDAGGMVHLSRQLSNLPFLRVQVLQETFLASLTKATRHSASSKSAAMGRAAPTAAVGYGRGSSRCLHVLCESEKGERSREIFAAGTSTASGQAIMGRLFLKCCK